MSTELRLLLDENIHAGVLTGLQKLGVDVVHARDVGLQGCSDIQILDTSVDERRILVTRDIRDFIRLARFFTSTRREFLGVLLVPSSFSEKEPAPLIRAIRVWIQQQDPGVEIAGGVSWLSHDLYQEGGYRLIQELQPAYIRALRRIEATA